MGPSTYIVAILVLNAVCAAPPPDKKPEEVVILEQENNFNGVDPWRWSNMTSNNQSKEESGELDDDEEPATPESYIYTSPEGIIYNVTYTRDEDNDLVLVSIPIGKGEPSVPEEGADNSPGDAGDPGRQELSGNAALSLIGRRK